MPNVKGSARLGGYKDRRYRSPIAMDNGDRDIIQDRPGRGLHRFQCRYPACGNIRWTDNKYLRYCSERCRTYHFASNDHHEHQGLEWMRQDTIFKKQIRLRWW